MKNYILLHKDKEMVFRSIFKFPLRPFLDIFGFDIVKFDEHIKTPDGVSMSEWVKEKFGDEGVKLIEELIK